MDLRTPHPTLQSLSQCFKLPSSSPQPSPRPLSPVPTSSVILKENDWGRPLATSTPWNRHASKSGIPSMPSSSGKLRSRLIQRRYSHHHSRSSSHSLSRSNPSSRPSSKEPYARRSGKPEYGHVLKSGAENPGSSVADAPRRKSKKTRRATTTALPLASPFVSRAPSPTGGAPENAHTATEFPKTGLTRQYTSACRRSAIPRSILTDTRYDSNLPVKTIVGNAPAFPQDKKGSSLETVYRHDFTLAKRKNKGFEKSIYTHNRTGSALKRQPSAPGALRYASTLRQKSILGPDRANKKTTESADENLSTKDIPTEVGRDAPVADSIPDHDDPNQTKSKNSDSIVDNILKPTKPHNDPPAAGPLIRPSLSMHNLQSHNTASRPEKDYIHEAHSNGDDERTAWMHMRSGVDFNRPPSQVSLIQAAGLDLGYSYQTWGDSLFSSSSSGESSCDENAGPASENELGKRDRFCKRRFSFDNLSMQTLEDEEAGLDLSVGFGLGLETAMGPDFDLDDIGEGGVPFGEDIRYTSTPIGIWRRTTNLSGDEVANTHIRKVASFPVIRSGDVVAEDREELTGRNGLVKSVSAEELKKPPLVREQALGNLQIEESGNATLAMERVHTYIDALENADEAETQSSFSWTTDSLISIPTVYLEKQKKRIQSSSLRDKKIHDNDGVLETGHQSSSTSESSSLAELTFGPAFEDECRGIAADEIQDSESIERLAKPIQLVSNITGNMTTKRTRSGTIVPVNPRVPPGARRTRSGTIVGPLPPTPPPTFNLPAIPAPGGLVDAVSGNCSAYSRVGAAAPTRTRSGTVVASTSVARSSASGLGAKTRNRGASVSGMRPMQNAAASGHQTDLVVMYEAEDIVERDDDEHIVECYVDSLYLPVESSPDPLDLLRFAGIAEAEDEDEEWRVVHAPFSPEAPKTKRRKVGLGLANRAASAGRWLKAKSKLTARFVGGADEEDRETTHGEPEAGALGDVESSDDELLLVDDSASKLMR